MASIRSKNTKPEMIVRKGLWSRGFRYRLNDKRLPGHPDLVLRKYRTCIFINGCFWHGHEGCKYYTIPKTNREFWVNKVQRNKLRDKQEQQKLAEMGWHSITVWECTLKPKQKEQTLDSIAYTLNSIFLQDRQVKYEPIEPEYQMAAEIEIETFNLDDALKDAKLPRFVYDEISLDGTSNLKKREETRTSNLQKK